MNIFELIEQHKNSFTKNENNIYAYIKKFPSGFTERNTPEIVSFCKVSQATLTRFTQKLGFSGISDFVYQYRFDYERLKETKNEKRRSDVYAELLKQAERQLTNGVLDTVASILDQNTQVYTTGYNLSNLPARQLDMYFKIQTSYNSQFLEFENMQTKFKTSSVLILFSSMRGEQYKQWLEKVRKTDDVKVILVTMNRKHILRKYADLTVILPTASSVSVGQTVFSETICFMMFNDLLMEYLVSHSDQLQNEDLKTNLRLIMK